MKLNARHILDRVGRAGAFTLLEILIAVAALGLIAVGVASIFAATGKTVKAGRSVSVFNAYAALIEQQLKSDFNAMTRDGFLVIRNEYAAAAGTTVNPTQLVGNANAVPLYDGDENPRLRRIDELLFFAKGDFQSARTPLISGVVAKSDAARIYYGHGERALQTAVLTDPYYKPEPNNQNIQGSQYLLGANDPTNPNRFASDWTLLRQVTLLCPPRTAAITMPPVPTGYAITSPDDGLTQVSLQPAASSVFRQLALKFPDPLPRTIRGAQRSLSSSGIVDIAATDLSLIRSIFMTANVLPDGNLTDFYNPNSNNNTSESSNPGVDNRLGLFPTGSALTAVVERMHGWMDAAFPADSMNIDRTKRARLRYEPSPTNFVGVLADTTLGSVEKNYRSADQVMLSASNFLPHCTEFIVEWSFGKTYPSDPSQGPVVAGKEGQIIWHGLDRHVGNPPSTANGVASFYNNNDTTLLAQRFTTPYMLANGTTSPTPALTTSQLIHDRMTNPPTVAPPLGGPLSSYFGFIDPTFNPDRDGDGKLGDDGDSISPTIPWAWPKLIRVTLSLADPNDPSIERTFQFVFQVPDRDGV